MDISKAKNKKDIIADKAIEIIINKGLSKLTMDEVARACDYSKGTLYNYYSNKDNLIVSAFIRLINKFTYRIDDIEVDDQETLDEKAEFYSKIYSKIFTSLTSDEILRTFEIILDSVNNKNNFSPLKKTFKNYFTVVLDKFEDLFDSKNKALMIQSMLVGLQLYKVFGVDFDEETLTHELKDIILKISE
jgi:AcrR family transcriptional regulator